MGLITYTYLVIMPSVMTGIDQTASYLATFRVPNVSGEIGAAANNLKNASSNIQGAGNNLRAAADSMPCAYGCGLAGVDIIDLSQMTSNLEHTASNLQGLGSNGMALSDNVDTLKSSIVTAGQNIEGQVHQAGYDLYSFKGIFQYSLLSILAVAVIGVLTGIALLVLVSKVDSVYVKSVSSSTYSNDNVDSEA